MIYQPGQNIKFQFTNKNISSNGGIFLYNDFLNCIDLKERLRKYVSFSNYSWIKHEPAQVIVQKILSLIAGYEDNNDVGDLQYDPVYRKILDDNLASQPTMSRIENAADLTHIIHGTPYCCPKTKKHLSTRCLQVSCMNKPD